jgi:hypothetical protein
MPIWRADYFDNPKDNAPSRSEIIVAENESDALHEARSKMGSLCSRAEVFAHKSHLYRTRSGGNPGRSYFLKGLTLN